MTENTSQKLNIFALPNWIILAAYLLSLGIFQWLWIYRNTQTFEKLLGVKLFWWDHRVFTPVGFKYLFEAISRVVKSTNLKVWWSPKVMESMFLLSYICAAIASVWPPAGIGYFLSVVPILVINSTLLRLRSESM